jgi:DnaA family protein
MKQLALGISPPPQPTLDNFVPGANAELLARLRELKAGKFADNVLYFWGEPGSGKAIYYWPAGEYMWTTWRNWTGVAQIGLFNAINEARQSGAVVLAAGNAPPAQLPLRADLKSRLAWGLVYQVKLLSDDERSTYLRAEATRRGMQLPDEVIAYLLTRMRRDMRSLNAILDRIDQVSLELKRPITLPLLREAIKE